MSPLSKRHLLLAPATLAAAALIGTTTGGAASADALACGQPAVPAVYQSVHHDPVTDVVPGVSTSTWLWSRPIEVTQRAYERVVAAAQGTYAWARTTPTTDRQYSELVVDRAAQPAIPAVTHTETTVLTWTYAQQQDPGHTRCEDSPAWNAGDNGKGWSLVGPCETEQSVVVDSPAVPAVTEQSHLEYVWVAQGDSAPTGYDATGATRPGAPTVEHVSLPAGDAPTGTGWVRGGYTETVPALTETVWVADGDAPPTDGTATGATRVVIAAQGSGRSDVAPAGEGWVKVDGSDEVTTTAPTTVVLVDAWDEQVLLSPEVPPTPACTTDPGTPDPGTTDPGTTDPGTTDPGSAIPDPGATTPDPGTGTPGPGTADQGGEGDQDGQAGAVAAITTVAPQPAAAVPVVAPAHAPAHASAGLANTGDPVAPWLLALGSGLVIGGTTIIVRQRRA